LELIKKGRTERGIEKMSFVCYQKLLFLLKITDIYLRERKKRGETENSKFLSDIQYYINQMNVMSNNLLYRRIFLLNAITLCLFVEVLKSDGHGHIIYVAAE